MKYDIKKLWNVFLQCNLHSSNYRKFIMQVVCFFAEQHLVLQSSVYNRAKNLASCDFQALILELGLSAFGNTNFPFYISSQKTFLFYFCCLPSSFEHNNCYALLASWMLWDSEEVCWALVCPRHFTCVAPVGTFLTLPVPLNAHTGAETNSVLIFNELSTPPLSAQK